MLALLALSDLKHHNIINKYIYASVSEVKIMKKKTTGAITRRILQQNKLTIQK